MHYSPSDNVIGMYKDVITSEKCRYVPKWLDHSDICAINLSTDLVAFCVIKDMLCVGNGTYS